MAMGFLMVSTTVQVSSILAKKTLTSTKSAMPAIHFPMTRITIKRSAR